MNISIKKTVIFILVFCIGFSCLAESERPSVTAKADELSEMARAWLPQHCFHSGSFAQSRTLAGLPQSLLSSGRYIYSCEHGFVWLTESPVSEALIYRHPNRRAYLVSDAGEIEPLNARTEKALAQLLAGILGGDLDVLKKRFDVQVSSSDLTLIPLRKKIRKFLTEIKVEKEKDLPVTLLSFASGESQSISIDDIRTYDALTEEQCVTNALPKDLCLLAFSESHAVQSK